MKYGGAVGVRAFFRPGQHALYGIENALVATCGGQHEQVDSPGRFGLRFGPVYVQ